MPFQLQDLAPVVAPLADLLGDLEASGGLAAYGVLVLILVLGACLVPIPEEAAFAIGGALASRGQLSLLGVYVTGWGTLVLLDLLLFTIGARAGPGIEHSRIGRRVGAARWARMHDFVRKRGAYAVAAARFVMGTRIPTFLLAGALGMPRRRFLAVVAVAGLVSAGLPLGLGYAFGAHLETLLNVIAASRWILLAAAALAVLLGWLYARRRAASS